MKYTHGKIGVFGIFNAILYLCINCGFLELKINVWATRTRKQLGIAIAGKRAWNRRINVLVANN